MPLKHKNKGILKHYIPNIKNAVIINAVIMQSLGL